MSSSEESPNQPETDVQIRSFGPQTSSSNRKRKLKGADYFQVCRNLQIFSKFYEGILGDKDLTLFATPEVIAKHIAERTTANENTCFVLDPFCGYAGNSIQFALACPNLFVLAIEMNKERIEFARNNAKVYGVEHRIDFVLGDSMELMQTCRFKPDVVFLSPPWGGRKYKKRPVFCLKHMPINGETIFKRANALTNNICYYLPRQQSTLNLMQTTAPYFEIEEEYLNDRLIALVAYYGDLIRNDDDTDDERAIKKVKTS